MGNLNPSRPTLSFSEAIKTVFNKYATFTGRARRSEYWYFVLFELVLLIIASIIDGIMGKDTGHGPVYMIVSLALFLPALGVLIRRLHDTGHSGWWWLISFVPIVGIIVLLIWLCKDSSPEPNKYGESPKYGYFDEETDVVL